MYLFFDTETTGKLDYKADPTAECQPDLVQLAAILTDPDLNVMGQLNVIVEPAGWSVPEEAAKVHRITTETARSFGVPRRVALASFNHFCKHAQYLVAHNIDFDDRIMAIQYHRDKAPHRMEHLKRICTMRAATPVLKIPKGWRDVRDPYKWPTLSETYAHYFNGQTFQGAHNAMVDVLALVKVFSAMLAAGHVSV